MNSLFHFGIRCTWLRQDKFWKKAIAFQEQMKVSKKELGKLRQDIVSLKGKQSTPTIRSKIKKKEGTIKQLELEKAYQQKQAAAKANSASPRRTAMLLAYSRGTRNQV